MDHCRHKQPSTVWEQTTRTPGTHLDHTPGPTLLRPTWRHVTLASTLPGIERVTEMHGADLCRHLCPSSESALDDGGSDHNWLKWLRRCIFYTVLILLFCYLICFVNSDIELFTLFSLHRILVPSMSSTVLGSADGEDGRKWPDVVGHWRLEPRRSSHVQCSRWSVASSHYRIITLWSVYYISWYIIITSSHCDQYTIYHDISSSHHHIVVWLYHGILWAPQ